MLEAIKINKQKLSISLNETTARQVERWQQSERLASKSEAIEKLLSKALDMIRQQEFENEVASYYQSMSEQELAERYEWVAASTERYVSSSESE
jgi:metal-responsive CopG/Arc/MetJ family transcriptional regulator